MNVDQMIAEGLSLIQLSQEHDLKVSFRCRLYAAFDEAFGERARQVRAKLATLAVEKVLPIWNSFLPHDCTPNRVLALSEQLLAGSSDLTSVDGEISGLWTHCDDLAWEYVDMQSVVMVGYSAIQVAREAMSEKHFGCEEVNDGSTDMDVDPYSHDAAFCAAIAYSAGPSWDETSDRKRRLEFWTWWLTVAVRAAIAGEHKRAHT